MLDGLEMYETNSSMSNEMITLIGAVVLAVVELVVIELALIELVPVARKLVPEDLVVDLYCTINISSTFCNFSVLFETKNEDINIF